MPVATQEKFVRFVSASMGFDFARGRIDRSTHPFCSGSHAGDVRITTRYRESDLLDGLGSTMHEVGHALYEQGLDEQAFGSPAGEAASLGVHESQSRLWENQVGRSAAFWRWAAPYATEFHAPGSRPFDPVSLWAAANHVVPGAIRVDADPVHYDLHVGIRFELERRMLRGELPVAELPAEWRRRMREQIGIEIRSDREGCLQDVHWAAGLIGYFPTYTLGNVYAAQLWAAAERALGSLPAQIERGEFAPLLGWLRQHVHRHGHLYAPAELIERATGAAPDPAFLLADLEQRLAPLYGL
jgi:carboxypeptidase Taq